MALNNEHDAHHAALLWRAGKLIRIGINGRESAKFRRFFDSGPPINYEAHAETDAMLRAQHGDRLEVLRWLNTGELSMSKPCSACASKIRQAKLASVRYTDWEGQWREFKV